MKRWKTTLSFKLTEKMMDESSTVLWRLEPVMMRSHDDRASI